MNTTVLSTKYRTDNLILLLCEHSLYPAISYYIVLSMIYLTLRVEHSDSEIIWNYMTPRTWKYTEQTVSVQTYISFVSNEIWNTFRLIKQAVLAFDWSIRILVALKSMRP